MPGKKPAKKTTTVKIPSQSRSQALNQRAFGLSFGIVTALFMFFLALIATSGWGNTLLLEIQSLYIGFTPGLLGAIIGALWGFVEGYIIGYLVAFFYNKFV